MAKVGYTPGPWMLEEGTTTVWGRCDHEANSSHGMGYVIAEFRVTPAGRWASGPNYDEGEANARLASFSPQLLTAGKHLVVKLAETYKAAGLDPKECQAIRDFMALAAKAEPSP